MKHALTLLVLLLVLAGIVASAAEPVPASSVGDRVKGASPATDGSRVLPADSFKHYVASFNQSDRETVVNHIPNLAAWDWVSTNVPLFECSNKDLEEIYCFRWWTFRKHIKQTADGFVITEFLPKVTWSGKHNTISCPAGHHFHEGRWIRNPKYLDEYSVFWFRKGGSPRSYSFWAADSILQLALVRGNFDRAVDLLPELITNYEAWEKARLEPAGLFWQIDDRDGMEVSIGGRGHCGEGKRPTINSYLYGDAVAIAAIEKRAAKPEIAPLPFGTGPASDTKKERACACLSVGGKSPPPPLSAASPERCPRFPRRAGPRASPGSD